jgi:hypothetical protein
MVTGYTNAHKKNCFPIYLSRWSTSNEKVIFRSHSYHEIT